MAYKTWCALCGVRRWRSDMDWVDGKLQCSFHQSQATLNFDGATVAEDETAPVRLTGQWLKVFDLVKDGQWWTLADLAKQAGGSEAAVSARLRDFRKEKFGGHVVEREHMGNGLWRYRVLLNREQGAA